MSNPVVYCYHCIPTGKKYIGATKNATHRHRQHVSNVRNGKYSHLPFYCAVSKYGWDNFIYGIITECDATMLQQLEDDYISQYNTIDEGYNVRNSGGGYNITGTYYHKPKRKKRVLSELHKQRISEAAKKRTIPQETRDKISASITRLHSLNATGWSKK